MDFENELGKIVIYITKRYKNTAIGRLVRETDDFVTIETKSGSIHHINKDDIVELYENTKKVE